MSSFIERMKSYSTLSYTARITTALLSLRPVLFCRYLGTDLSSIIIYRPRFHFVVCKCTFIQIMNLLIHFSKSRLHIFVCVPERYFFPLAYLITTCIVLHYWCHSCTYHFGSIAVLCWRITLLCLFRSVSTYESKI